jgi:hypothetical protein
MIIYLSVLPRMRNVSEKSCRESQNTFCVQRGFFSFFRTSCCSWDNVEKYCRAGQATDDNTLGYRDALRICNTYCISTKAPQCYFICTLPLFFFIEYTLKQTKTTSIFFLFYNLRSSHHSMFCLMQVRKSLNKWEMNESLRFEVDKIMRVKIRMFWLVNPSGLHFYPEDGGISFLRNVRTNLPRYIVSQYTKL